MDEFHDKAIEQEWPADIDKLSAKDRKALVKKLVKAAKDLRVQYRADMRDGRIMEASLFARAHSSIPYEKKNDRPGEKLVKGKIRGMEKRSVGMSL